MQSSEQQRVWDPLVRIFHWTLASAFVVAWVTEDDLLTLHVWAGYIIGGLLLLRLLWGVVGSRHARFGDFVRSPATVMGYLRDVIAFRARRHIGHNPAGGAMVVTMLLLLTAATLSGLAVYGAGEFSGPLASLFFDAPNFWGDLLEGLHELCANVTLLLVVFHLLGVLLASLQHRENLVRSMITGLKRGED